MLLSTLHVHGGGVEVAPGNLPFVVLFSEYRSNQPNDGGIIRNSGVIRSTHVGIDVATIPGLTTVIVNAVGGIIRGGTGPSDDALSVIQGQFSIQNLRTRENLFQRG